jgi:hypothetical protein
MIKPFNQILFITPRFIYITFVPIQKLLMQLAGTLMADNLPEFRWLSERSSSGIQHLGIRYSGEELTAILHPYNPGTPFFDTFILIRLYKTFSPFIHY